MLKHCIAKQSKLPVVSMRQLHFMGAISSQKYALIAGAHHRAGQPHTSMFKQGLTNTPARVISSENEEIFDEDLDQDRNYRRFSSSESDVEDVQGGVSYDGE